MNSRLGAVMTIFVALAAIQVGCRMWRQYSQHFPAAASAPVMTCTFAVN